MVNISANHYKANRCFGIEQTIILGYTVTVRFLLRRIKNQKEDSKKGE